MLEERPADQLALNQQDDQLTGRQATAADLDRPRAALERKLTIDQPGYIEPAGQLAADRQPAYGVRPGSSARTMIRPGPVAPLPTLTLRVSPLHRQSLVFTPRILPVTPDGKPRKREAFHVHSQKTRHAVPTGITAPTTSPAH